MSNLNIVRSNLVDGRYVARETKSYSVADALAKMTRITAVTANYSPKEYSVIQPMLDAKIELKDEETGAVICVVPCRKKQAVDLLTDDVNWKLRPKAGSKKAALKPKLHA